MNSADLEYKKLCETILEKGVVKEDRTGTGTISYFGPQMRFDLQEGFPLLTTKKVNFRLIKEELLWFLRGSTNVKELQELNVKIWDADYARWIREGNPDTGDLGPIYGEQWRSWPVPEQFSGEDVDGRYYSYVDVDHVDQIANVIESIKNNPDSRRHIVSAWNVGQLEEMALPPCHTMFQFYVAEGKLSCKLYQRSGDVFLGVPFNIASYALLTHMIAQVCDLEVGELVHTFGDAHIYTNHVEQIKEQISRDPLKLPTLKLNPEITNIDDFKSEDISVEDYEHHPPIKGKVSVG